MRSKGPQQRALSGTAFATLLLIALMMGANHVAARFAFNDGADVTTAVALRSSITAIVVACLLWFQKVTVAFNARQRLYLPVIGVLIAVQSLCLYSSVARLPVALALLAFNTYPLFTALWQWLIYKVVPPRNVLLAMPLLLFGLALALDVLGAASGLGASAQWASIGVGVAFGMAAGATFGLALVFTQHKAADVEGRLRTATTMATVALLAAIALAVQGGPHWPRSHVGWLGLVGLTFLYGTAFTIMFTVLPKLGVVGGSAIMNVEPVFALVLAWALLGQVIAPVQVVGSLLVVATVVVLGLRKG